jgi:hypothetical protein
MWNHRIYPRLLITLALLLVLSLLAQRQLPSLAAPPQQTDTPPVLVESSPADGAMWGGGPVTFTFDQPLTPGSANALTIQPTLTGETMVAGATLTFTPTTLPEPGVRYRFSLQTVTSLSGATLATPVEVTLVALAPLQVTSTQPGDGASDVSTPNPIIVVFNRPVVPLTGIEEQAGLPQPLTIEPAVEGQGTWLNTSVFAFQPTLGLAGATEYRVTVADVTGLVGETLAEPVLFRFTTAAPLVLDATPQGNQAPPDSPIVVTFSQPMDSASTDAAFSLVKTSGERPQPVAGTITWDATGTTLTFSPTGWLDFDGGYTIAVTDEAQPASRQGRLREAFTRDFDVVPLPAVDVITPLDGAEDVPPDAAITIRFNTPLSYTTVLPNIQVTPTLTTTQIYSYYSEYNSEASLSWVKEPNTRYTVTVGSVIQDRYGNTLGQETVFHFTTGDYTPFTQINLDRFTHFSAYTETRVSVYYRNVEQVEAELFRLPVEEFLKLSGQNQWELWNEYQIPDRTANRLWARRYAPRVDANVTGQQVISLTTATGELLGPGLYLLEVQQPPPVGIDLPDEPPQPLRALIVLSNHHLVLKKSQSGANLVWLTDLRTGQPVADQVVQFHLDGAAVVEATTNIEGLATAELPLTPDNSYWPVRVLIGEPGDATFAAVSSEWNTGVAVWDFGLNGGYSAEPYQLHFYTDRPIYRPGQTIYWKGIVRVLEDAGFALPERDMALHIVVRDDRGNAVLENEYTLNANGTVDGQVELAVTAVTGYYYLEARLGVGERTVYGGAGFQVAAYRRPEFAITVAADEPEYQQGDTVQIGVQADYFSGGALGSAPLTWRLIAEPFFFEWTKGPADRYYTFAPYDPDQENADPYQGVYYGGLLQEGTGETAADGSFTIEVPADLADVPQSQRWAFDVTVQSPTNQFVSGRTTVPVHKAGLYIGLSPRTYVVDVGAESTVDIVTVTPQGDPYSAAELTLIVYEYEWNNLFTRAADGNFRWATSVIRTPVLTTTATTDRQGVAEITWTPDKGGQYQILARGADDADNRVNSAAYVYVSSEGGQFITWPRANNDRINLVADKELYTPGETAHILVPSPFAGPVGALLTIERAGVLQSRLITLTGTSETIAIPISEEYIPNIFVSVILVKGVDETNPLPAMRVGYVQLNVDTRQKELTVDVTPSSAAVQPGDTVTYTLTVRDSTGAPAPDAEVSVALVDKAVLSLATGDPRTLLDIFYFQRPLGVTTGLLLSINKDRLSQQLSDGAKGGGGGGGGGLEIRADFPDIAFWQAAFTTDAAGQIVFPVTLPDNLTTWTLSAKAITPETLVGEVTHDLVASKELQVRPLLPRFFTAGDRAQIGAVIRNTTAEEVNELRFAITASGATLDTAATVLTTTVAANGQTELDFPLTVGAEAASVVLTMTAQSSTLADAVRVELPVRRYETPEVVSTAGGVPAEGRVEAIRLPEGATENGELSVTLEPSLAAGMIEGLTYLEHYPYECNEQTVSRFLPNLFTVRALRALNLENRQLEDQLSYQLGIGVQRLVSRQNADGGWGYWPGEESNPFVTSYVVWGLGNAAALEYTVPERTLTNAISYLDGQFAAPKDVAATWRLNELAFTNFVLTELGEGDPGRASTLYDERERLNLYGRALLAMTLAQQAESAQTTDERVDTLLDDLFGAAQISATGASWHEAGQDFRNMNTDVRTTSMVLAAFARLEGDQPLLPNVVRWLMSAREASRWATTQENAWAIIALTDWLVASGELEGEYAWSVQLNGAELGQGTVTAENLTERVELRAAVTDLLRDEANLLLINRAQRAPDASGQLYYTTHLRYYLDALAIEPRDRGIVVDRRFTADGVRVSEARVGEVISVTVTIVAPTDLYHALIEVPIPAGVELIDVSLATTSDEFTGPELQPVVENQPTSWYAWTPSYTDLRDDRVALFTTRLAAGVYEYTFQARATVPGEYRVLPVYGAMMYFSEVWGRSGGALFTVTE